MYTLKANFHNHTRFSDGLYSPKHVLKFAKERGFGLMVITDHNEYKGSVEFMELAAHEGIISFFGSELVFMDDGKISELLAYFRTKEDIESFFSEFQDDNFWPKCDDVGELLTLVRKHNGVSIAPHPYGFKGLLGNGDEADFSGIEIANAYISPADNRRAKEYANSHPNRYHTFGAADLHVFPSALNAAYTVIESDEPITADAVWDNLKGISETMAFKGVGGSLPTWKRFLQECVICISVPKYLIRQDYNFFKLHNFHNFKKHHRKW